MSNFENGIVINKEKERKHYRDYFASNTDLEKERVKRARISNQDSFLISESTN